MVLLKSKKNGEYATPDWRTTANPTEALALNAEQVKPQHLAEFEVVQAKDAPGNMATRDGHVGAGA